MSLFKRLSATLYSRIDQVVGEIENHDAVIQVSLDEVRKKVGEAKFRLTQLQREENRLQQQISAHQAEAQQWQRRAIEVGKENEHTAIECLRRARHCQQQADSLNKAAQQYQQHALNLGRDIQANEQQLREIKQKQTLLRARESSSAALNATQQHENTTARLIEDTFDRWELNITRSEILNDIPPVTDTIEDAFARREEDQSLRDELTALLKEEK